MDSDASGDGGNDGPVTVDLLADLRAGLLDDHTAAALRRRARTDPDVARRLAALDRVRHELADLGADPATASPVPPEVTYRVRTALRSQPPPARAPERRGHPRTLRLLRPRTAAAAAGVIAVVAAGVVGTTVLLRTDALHRTDAVGPSGVGAATSSMAASRQRGGIPLPDADILGLLDEPPELGVLANPQRRQSCLGALGYPGGTPVLGARPLDVMGRPGLLLVLPGDGPNRIDAVVVAPNCSSVDTGLLGRTALARP